jgi:hypothetical protein
MGWEGSACSKKKVKVQELSYCGRCSVGQWALQVGGMAWPRVKGDEFCELKLWLKASRRWNLLEVAFCYHRKWADGQNPGLLQACLESPQVGVCMQVGPCWEVGDFGWQFVLEAWDEKSFAYLAAGANSETLTLPLQEVKLGQRNVLSGRRWQSKPTQANCHPLF